MFSVHDNYIAMGMMIDRADLEKTRIHDQAKHEVALSVMKVVFVFPSTLSDGKGAHFGGQE